MHIVILAPAPCAALVDGADGAGAAVTSWGEAARLRLSCAQTGGRLAVLDHRAPPRFGPGRHVHLHDDEIFLVQEGRLALWTPEATRMAGPGDLVFLPRAQPHTWRAYGDEPVHLQVIVAPGEFEAFFPTLADNGVVLDDAEGLAVAARRVAVEFLGPPLTDAEVDTIARTGRRPPQPSIPD